MDTTQRVHIAGWCGVVGGSVWFIQSVLQWAGVINGDTPGTTTFVVTGVVATLCLGLVLLSFLGLKWGGAFRGRFGSIVWGVAVLGYVLMISGGVLTLFGVGPLTDPVTAVSLIYLLGRLIAVIFTLLTGIAVVQTRRWPHWTRFAPLLLGLWPIVGELLPVLVTGQQPNELVTGAWGVCVALVGMAMLAQTGATRTSPAPAIG